jgi:NAD(P)-dependent dehydrogenase (short-subunit alcohol dehydrogenase family)
VGGISEAGGLVLVGIGISDTRSRFTDAPGILSKFGTSIKNLFRRFRAPRTLKVGIADSVELSGSVTMRTSGSANIQGTLEERITRLEQMTERHGRAISAVEGDISAERTVREEAVRAIRAEVVEADEKIEALVANAAAGGLALETWGVTLFLIGVVLTTWGGLIA